MSVSHHSLRHTSWHVHTDILIMQWGSGSRASCSTEIKPQQKVNFSSRQYQDPLLRLPEQKSNPEPKRGRSLLRPQARAVVIDATPPRYKPDTILMRGWIENNKGMEIIGIRWLLKKLKWHLPSLSVWSQRRISTYQDQMLFRTIRYKYITGIIQPLGHNEERHPPWS